jgi:Fe-S-cluster containining protein
MPALYKLLSLARLGAHFRPRDFSDFPLFALSEYEFIQRFTRLRRQRDGLALEENADGGCVFLEGKNCRINAVKPDQCAGFPNTWNFPGWRDICEAVPVVEEN